jgi:hypothetical protein
MPSLSKLSLRLGFPEADARGVRNSYVRGGIERNLHREGR